MKIDLGSCVALVDDDDAALVAPYHWWLSSHGYAVAWQPRKKMIYLHRVILGLQEGDGLKVDHDNGDKLDNRRANLVIRSHADNIRNRKRPRKGVKTSRYRNVYRRADTGKWAVNVHHEGKTINLGSYEDEDEAGRVATEWRREHWGEFAV